jgi:cation transport ATPase
MAIINQNKRRIISTHTENKDMETDKNFQELKSEFENFKKQSTERLDDLSVIAFHNKIRWRLSIFGFLFAFLLGLFAISTSLRSFSLDSMAYLGWTTAVLTTIIVILMGWQIFNIIEYKGHREEIKEVIKRESNSLHKHIKQTKENLENELREEIDIQKISKDVILEIDQITRSRLRAKGIK